MGEVPPSRNCVTNEVSAVLYSLEKPFSWELRIRVPPRPLTWQILRSFSEKLFPRELKFWSNVLKDFSEVLLNEVNHRRCHVLRYTSSLFNPRDPAEGLLLGPGHGSMVTDDSGNDWFVYHAWIGPASNIEIDPPGRVICIDKIVSCRYKCQPWKIKVKRIAKSIRPLKWGKPQIILE